MLAILPKIKINEIVIFQDALKNYVDSIRFIVENQQQQEIDPNDLSLAYWIKKNDILKYEFSIANDLWRTFNKKIEKLPQPINSTIKLSYHEAATLKKALLSYQVDLPTTNLDRAIIERLKKPLLQQT